MLKSKKRVLHNPRSDPTKLLDSINFKKQFNDIVKTVKSGKFSIFREFSRLSDVSLVLLKIDNEYIDQEFILPRDEYIAFSFLYKNKNDRNHYFYYISQSSFLEVLSKIIAYNYLSSKQKLDHTEHENYLKHLIKFLSDYILFFRRIYDLLEDQEKNLQKYIENNQKLIPDLKLHKNDYYQELEFYKNFFGLLEQKDVCLFKLKYLKQTYGNIRKMPKESLSSSFLSVREFTENMFGILDNSFNLSLMLNILKEEKELFEIKKLLDAINFIAQKDPKFMELLRKSLNFLQSKD